MLRSLKLILTLALANFAWPATAQNETGMPDLSRVWKSDFGDMYWIGGYYGNREKLIKGKLSRTTSGEWIFSGNWGRIDDRRGATWMGDVSFTFSADGESFTGSYYSNEKPFAWNGRIGHQGAYSAGQNSPGDISYNGPLEFQMRNAVGAKQEALRIQPTQRCDQEMINWLKGGGLSDTSVRKFCGN